MVYEKRIKGEYVYLESASVKDADFTLSLRQNPDLTKYLPKLNITAEQQRLWVENQRKTIGDYFFVVKRYDHSPIGTVSIYGIQEDSSESGRLALIGNSIENTEACLLLFRFAFNILNLKTVTGYIVDSNRRADRFNRQFGCITGEVEIDQNGERIRRTLITSESFHNAEKKLKKLLYKEKSDGVL